MEDEETAEREGEKEKERERGGGRRTNARVLHTPLHLLVNRINQRHHGLSPIPLRPRAPTFLNPPPCCFLTSAPRFLGLSLLPPRPMDSIAIYSETRTDVTLQHPCARGVAREMKSETERTRREMEGIRGREREDESRRRATLGEAIDA